MQTRTDARNKQHLVQLLTQSPFEKQAIEYLTDFARNKFVTQVMESVQYGCQEETVEQAAVTLRVWHLTFSAEYRTVVLGVDSEGMQQYSCSCKLFEFSGIVCRHIIRACQQQNVSELNPRYFLSRWRKDPSDVELSIQYISNSLRSRSHSEFDSEATILTSKESTVDPDMIYHDLNLYCK